jgi:tRNA 2-thiouridine synthesizing protein A
MGMAAEEFRLNALGLACPLPLLLAIRDMAALLPGQILEIVGDDPGLLADIPLWCAKAGHELVEIEEDEGVIVCRVAKGGVSSPVHSTDLLTSPPSGC